MPPGRVVESGKAIIVPQVSREPLFLHRAFERTYGLKFGELFWWEGLSIKLYEVSGSEIIHALGQLAWRHERKRLIRVDPQIVTPKFS